MYGDDIVAKMDEMHDILDKAGIGINNAENLIIVSHGSHKAMHTKQYIIAIYHIMKPAEGRGKEAALIALGKARKYVESLDQYKNGW